jgi:hypothetical protein
MLHDRFIVRQWLIPIMVLMIIAFVAPSAVTAREITGYVTFETGADSDPILLPGFTLQNERGEQWLYGDVRTRQYNAPYPDNCQDRPATIARPICEYTMTGNNFAWAGPLGAIGELRFTDGTASFVGLSLSNSVQLNIIAYNSTNAPILARSVAPNAGTGNTAFVELIAPRSERIARVRIEGVSSLWLLDDFLTDAPGVPDQRDRVAVLPALVTATLGSMPNVAVPPGGLLTLRLVITNRGTGGASDALIRIPLDHIPGTVLDAHFDRSGVWVSQLDRTQIVLRTGPLEANATVTATIRLQIHPEARIDQTITLRSSVSWVDNVLGGRSTSNQIQVVVSSSEQSQLHAALQLDVGPDRNVISLLSPIFLPHEPISVWYTQADGTSSSLGSAQADMTGLVSHVVERDRLPDGRVTLVVYGNWSELAATASFQR